MTIPAEEGLRVRCQVALSLLVLVTGCVPCAGTASCTTEPRFVLLGSFVEPLTRKAAPGVRFEIALTRQGLELARATIKADKDGLWSARAGAGGATDPALAQVTVNPGTPEAFVIPPFEVKPVTKAGEATLLPSWTSRPYGAVLRSILLDGAPLRGAIVRFTPTGGVALPGVTELTGETNGAGIFEFFVVGAEVGDALGTLEVEHPRLTAPDPVTNFQVPVGYVFDRPVVRGSLFFYSK